METTNTTKQTAEKQQPKRASKTWEAMMKYGNHVTVNDPSLLN